MWKRKLALGCMLASCLAVSSGAEAAVTYQVTDTSVNNCSPDGNHGLWTNNLLGNTSCPRNYFSIQTGTFTLNDDDANPDNWTGSLVGTAVNPLGEAASFNIDFSGFLESYGGYKQEGGGAYNPATDTPDVDFFTMATGTVTVLGVVYTLAADPFDGMGSGAFSDPNLEAVFQFGEGANAKDGGEFGASTWLNLVSPNGQLLSGPNGHFDFNLTLTRAIPEPSAFLLFSLGLLGVGVAVRRRRYSA